jgi:hypothetical protein
MNSTLMFLQADMHRAINDGRRSLEVSVLDLKELIAQVMSSESREQFERVGQSCGFMRPEKLQDLRSGKRMYCTVRLRKNEEFTSPIFYLPDPKPPIDVVAETEENTPLPTA